MRKLSVAVAALLIVACSKDAPTPTENPSLVVAVGDSLAPLYEMGNPRRVPGEYIVRLRDDVDDVDGLARAVAIAHNGTIKASWRGLKGFWARLPEAAIEPLRRNPHVRYIEANTLMYPSTTYQAISYPNDNWGLDRIDQLDNRQDGVYEYDYDGTGVHIWIVDTGVDETIPEIASRVDHDGYFSFNGTNPFTPCISHGTHVAVMAAGSVHGVAKGATINVARVSDDCVDGSMSTAAASSAFEFIGDYAWRPAIANYSAGRECGWLGCGITVDDAVEYAIAHGVQVTVSAGNDGNDACDYTPAHVGDALTVAASDKNDSRVLVSGDVPWASNYGSCVDLFAPGVKLASYVGTFGGTSGAAPMVAGVAALYLQQHPTATPAAVRQYVTGNASGGMLVNIGNGSPDRVLHSRPTLAAPSVSNVATLPSPAKQYTPFKLTISGSGFDPALVEVLIGPAGCGSRTSCVSLTANSGLSTKSSTQLVISTLVYGTAGTKDVYVRNGKNGAVSLPKQFTVAPAY